MDQRTTLYFSAIVTAIFVSLFLLERSFPLRKAWHSLAARLVVNLCVSALAFGTAFAAVRPAAMAMLHFTSDQPFGVLHLVEIPAPLRFGLAFLLLDLAYYYWHLANHKIPLLWRFHNVHHIDPDLDVSTAFRFHFGEVALSAGFRIVQVALIGPTAIAYFLYELIFQANTVFHHSNMRLPIRFERLLNKFLVTPRMHGIHHSQVRGETNSNYSVVFPWWDRLHRTLGLNIPQSEIVIGIPGYSGPSDNKLGHVLTLPFRKQRDYWRSLDGAAVERNPAVLQPDPERLAE